MLSNRNYPSLVALNLKLSWEEFVWHPVDVSDCSRAFPVDVGYKVIGSGFVWGRYYYIFWAKFVRRVPVRPRLLFFNAIDQEDDCADECLLAQIYGERSRSSFVGKVLSWPRVKAIVVFVIFVMNGGTKTCIELRVWHRTLVCVQIGRLGLNSVV